MPTKKLLKRRGVRRRAKIHPSIKEALGFPATAKDTTVLRAWKAASRRVCKPCWELKYCPYGPLVEQSPILPVERPLAAAHQEYLKKALKTGRSADGKKLDEKRRKWMQYMVAEYDEGEHPESIPTEIEEMKCRIFGHICPVVFNAEAITETTDLRRVGRTSIPTHVLMRVARRDNYTCQICQTPLPDYAIEFDHIIPVARGGSSEEHNIRVTCFDCNRGKGKRFEL